MDRESFFDGLRNENDAHGEALREQRQLAYEERCIKRVFRECGIKINGWGRYANQCREVTGRDKLNFEWFNSTFRAFPGTLCGKRIPQLHELTLLDLFKPSKNNRLIKKLMRGLGESASFHFVFMFPVTRTMFVAHRNEDRNGPIERIVWAAVTDDSLFVEPSTSFFAAIGTEWFEQ